MCLKRATGSFLTVCGQLPLKRTCSLVKLDATSDAEAIIYMDVSDFINIVFVVVLVVCCCFFSLADCQYLRLLNE